MSCLSFLQMQAANGAAMTELGGNLQAGAGLLNSISSLASGISAGKVGKANAAAQMALAQTEANSIRRAGGKELGAARAAAAASGVSVASGSVLEAERDIVRYSEQDAMMAIITGQSRASAAKAAGADARAKMFQDAGESLLSAGAAWRRTRRKVPYRADDPYRNPGYFGGDEGE